MRVPVRTHGDTSGLENDPVLLAKGKVEGEGTALQLVKKSELQTGVMTLTKGTVGSG